MNLVQSEKTINISLENVFNTEVGTPFGNGPNSGLTELSRHIHYLYLHLLDARLLRRYAVEVDVFTAFRMMNKIMMPRLLWMIELRPQERREADARRPGHLRQLEAYQRVRWERRTNCSLILSLG